MADSLKMRYICRLMDGEESDWSNLLRISSGKDYEGRLMATRLGGGRLKRLLQQNFGGGVPYDTRIVHSVVKKAGISMLMHMSDGLGWANLHSMVEAKQIRLAENQKEELQLLQRQLTRLKIGAQKLQQSKSWIWEGTQQVWKGWHQKTNFWRRILGRAEKTDDMKGEYTLTWAQRQIWRDLHRLTEISNTDIRIKANFLATLDEGLTRKGDRGELLHIIVEVTKSVRENRNKHIFLQRRQHTPLTLILANAKRELEASLRITFAQERWDKGIRAIQEIQKLIEVTSRWSSRDEGSSTPAPTATHRVNLESSARGTRPPEEGEHIEDRNLSSNVLPALSMLSLTG
ncbi:hypothetical protein R1sor_016277 [Riccia sorocarpa]|uniref:Uncharacterized protein n=1 Tax=Riccia sorocarpa TaxID=122646 RepID=A0ABD3HEY8_9MARC